MAIRRIWQRIERKNPHGLTDEQVARIRLFLKNYPAEHEAEIKRLSNAVDMATVRPDG